MKIHENKSAGYAYVVIPQRIMEYKQWEPGMDLEFQDHDRKSVRLVEA